jgi:hypothetical protein
MQIFLYFLTVLSNMNADHYRKRARIFLGLAIPYYILMGVIFYFAKDPLNVFESQLAFEAWIIRNEYFWITYNGGMTAYRIAQYLDFGFMILYGGFIFFTLRGWAIKMEEESDKILYDVMVKWGHRAKTLAWCGIVAAGLDVVENLLIFQMLEYYYFHQDVLAIQAFFYSFCALIKWILLGFCLVLYIFLSLLYKRKTKLSGKNTL